MQSFLPNQSEVIESVPEAFWEESLRRRGNRPDDVIVQLPDGRRPQQPAQTTKELRVEHQQVLIGNEKGNSSNNNNKHDNKNNTEIYMIVVEKEVLRQSAAMTKATTITTTA